MVLSRSAHCAIAVVVELARHYQKKGMTGKDISRAQDIPLNLIEEAVLGLELLSVIVPCKIVSSDTLLYLTKSPELIIVGDIIKNFDKEPFCGAFVDDQVLWQVCR